MLILSQEALKTLASSVVMGASPVRATKTLVVARKQGESNFVCTCLRAQSMMELNQKHTKHSQKMLDKGIYTGEKYQCKNLVVIMKEGRGRLLKLRGHILGTYSIYI